MDEFLSENNLRRRTSIVYDTWEENLVVREKNRNDVNRDNRWTIRFYLGTVGKFLQSIEKVVRKFGRGFKTPGIV